MNKLLVILLGVFGFASVSIFIMWGVLHLIGEPETAEEIKNIPNTIEEAKQEALDESKDALVGAVVVLNENRKKAVEQEEDPNVKNIINLIYLVII